MSNYTPITQVSLAPGHYTVVVIGLTTLILHTPMNTILPQVDCLLYHYTKIGVIRSTGDSNIVVYMSMEGQHTIRSLYCYGLLELGLEHRCLLL